jgi:hypothetical protein
MDTDSDVNIKRDPILVSQFVRAAE